MRICSKRPARKQAKVAAKGIFPASASPAATPTMFPSAMPSWKKRSGYRSAKALVLVELARSASSTTIRSSVAPRRASARPKATRVASAMARDLLEGARRLLGGGGLPVPRRLPLHERHPLALHGVRDEEPRAAAAPGLVERLDHLREIVAVGDHAHVPVEAAPLLGERFGIHDLLDRAVELDLVVVEDDDQLFGLVLAGRHRGLPHLPRLRLAVAEQAEDAPPVAVQAARERHAERERKPLAEGAGGGLDPGERHAVGVTLEAAPELAERRELGDRELAGLGQRRVHDRHPVALGDDEAVALGPGGITLAAAERVEEEDGHDLGGRERAARVPRAGGGDHTDHVLAEPPRDGREPRHFLGGPRHHARPAGWTTIRCMPGRSPFELRAKVMLHAADGRGGSGSGWCPPSGPAPLSSVPPSPQNIS